MSEQRPTPERLAHIRANVALWLRMLRPTEAIVTASELLAELDAVTAERDARILTQDDAEWIERAIALVSPDNPRLAGYLQAIVAKINRGSA